MNSKKDIYLITRHNIINHGSILQTIASIKFFKDHGFECTVINYVNKKEKGFNIVKEALKSNNKWNSNSFRKIAYYFIKTPSYFLSKRKFSKYRKKYLKLTEEYNSIIELEKVNFGNAILCSGSDQLWGPIIDGTIDEAYFLSFNNINKKISFSSSMGRKIEYDPSIINLLNKYEFITMRERPSIDYLKSKNVSKISHVFDPTMMIEKDFWYKFTSNKKITKDYILLYRIHDNPRFEEEIKKFSRNENIPIYRIGNAIDDIFLYGKVKLNVTLEGFLRLIKNAKYVFTDSFHCTQFSVIFEKKFLVISPKATSIRILDFLEEVDLKEQFIESEDKLIKIKEQEIDYNKVNNIIDSKRKVFTNEIIEGINNILTE